jgi:hypothetical protein
MKHESSFVCSQNPATDVYSQPEEHDPHPQSYVPDIHFNIILPLYLGLPNGRFPSFQILTPSLNKPQEIFICCLISYAVIS